MNRIASLVGLVGLSVIAACAVESPEGAEQTGTAESELTKQIGPVDPADTTALPGKTGGLGAGGLGGGGTVLTPDVPPARLGAPTYQALATGDGWRTMKINGSLVDSDSATTVAADEDVVVVDSADKLAGAPISAALKASISQELAQLPLDERSGSIIVRKSIEAELAKPPPANAPMALAGCSNVDKTFTKTVSKTKPFSYAQGNEAGAFTGSVNVDGTASGAITASVVLRVKRVWLPFAGCTSYWGSLKKAQLTGTADVLANAKADGNFAKEWHKSKTVVEPVLFDDWVSIGGIPVDLKVSLPIEAGIDASAKVDVDMDAHVEAHGNFDITCRSGGCDGSKSTSFGFQPNKPATVGLNMRAHIVPWAKASVKISLYEGIATGKLGVKASLDSDFWGYSGNTCGDSNGDGVGEFVQAATLDARLLVDLEASVGFFGANKTYAWNLLNRHLGFWDLLGHSTALDPIFFGGGGKDAVRGRMRPCYPYGDTVHYRIDWKDGSPVQAFDASPSVPFIKSHAYNDLMAYTQHHPVLTAATDVQSRALNGSTTATVGRTPVFAP